MTIKDDGWWQPVTPLMARWARDELKLDDPAGSPAAQAALLRQLEANDFLPTPGWQTAFELTTAAGAEGRAPLEVQREAEAHLGPVEAELRTRIDALRQNFLQLSLDERRERLRALTDECQDFPALTEPLKHLERGLFADLSLLARERPVMRELANQLARLYSLPPAERGLQRRMAVMQWAPTVRTWESLARELASQYPKIAELDPRLHMELSQLSRKRRPLDRPGLTTLRTQSPQERKPLVRSYGWAVVATLLLLTRLFTSSPDRSSRNVPTPLPWESPVTRPVAAPLVTSSSGSMREAIESIRTERLRSQMIARGELSEHRLPPRPKLHFDENVVREMGIPDEVLDPAKPIPQWVVDKYWFGGSGVVVPGVVTRDSSPANSNPQHDRALEILREYQRRRNNERNEPAANPGAVAPSLPSTTPPVPRTSMPQPPVPGPTVPQPTVPRPTAPSPPRSGYTPSAPRSGPSLPSVSGMPQDAPLVTVQAAGSGAAGSGIDEQTLRVVNELLRERERERSRQNEEGGAAASPSPLP